jgi:hypothetical protein
MQVSPVTMSHLSTRASAPLFTAVYKRPAEGGLEAFAFCLWLLLWALTWVFRFGFLLLAFWCGKLLEGKRIVKGKLLKEKEWL